MKKKREGVEGIVQELVKKGILKLEKEEIEKHAGTLSKEVKDQLDALIKSDGCYCPDPPGNCHC